MENVAVWMGRQSCFFFFPTDSLPQEKIESIPPIFFPCSYSAVSDLLHVCVYIHIYSAQLIYCIYTENYPPNHIIYSHNVVRMADLASSQNPIFAFKDQNFMVELQLPKFQWSHLFLFPVTPQNFVPKSIIMSKNHCILYMLLVAKSLFRTRWGQELFLQMCN